MVDRLQVSNLTLNNNFSSRSFDNLSDDELKKSGYNPLPFEGKLDQIEKVQDALDEAGFIPEPLIESEVRWFYESLGIDDVYFARESVQGIVSHIHALYSAKLESYSRGENENPTLQHKREADDHAVYFDSSDPKSPQFKLINYEERIDDRYLDHGVDSPGYRLESFSSAVGNVRCYFVYKCSFPKEAPAAESESLDLTKISDETFLKICSNHTKRLYSEIINDVAAVDGPIIKHFGIKSTGEHRVIIGYRQNSSPRYNSALTSLCQFYGLKVTRKYVEQFSNGISIISMYITPPDAGDSSFIQFPIDQVVKEASLLYTIPHNIFQEEFAKGELSIQECIYAHCGVIFVTHFLNRLGTEYQSLLEILNPNKNLLHFEILSKIKDRLRTETFTQDYITEVFKRQTPLVKKLYRSFADVHYINSKLEKTLSYKRLEAIEPIKSESDFENLLNHACSQNQRHALILRALFSFNKSILKTNFFLPSKIAISFRLEPSFLPALEYPNKPFGMFFVVGSEFRGFHIRFRDIARGGIRIVKSRSVENYNVNKRNLFDENYNLASTQQRKNKDIPEGGAKGVILLDPQAQERPKECFIKYIDSLMDLLLLDHQDKSNGIVDLYNKPEILFMGPDENSAGYVDWATLHARKRGAPWWKSFFTGKSQTLGGIPHDEYGMTSLSVRAYVNKIYEKLDIKDLSKITKLQTGGPDGDLGSNEIKLSRDESYVAIVDGSGVIVDENGLDKAELLSLATKRKMVDQFDRTKLSPKGYFVSVDDVDFKTPDGKIITNGTVFRNTFHLKIADVFGKDRLKLFVPCGGRPNSIDANNVHFLIDENTGKSYIPFIVEGANLFISQAAKVQLEKAGTVLFKDASTNKGGVTSSSLEVLAALSFNDEGFLSNMCLDPKTGVKPEFYQEYVKQVQKVIVANAESEFESLWALNKETGKPLSDLSNDLSIAINDLADQLSSSEELWNDDLSFRNAVLQDALPPLLLEKIGIESIVNRVPVNYLKALFATRLASRFVYTRGIDANPARFLEFISSLKREYKSRGL
ncbi:hypothetical protein LJB42_003625 [Komagataella kurtzmanii]|nr:hypothetical protein LJB42_003625 [Komagataella kurtzmanii]